MTEITRVHLENEMDLILSHKQTMKLAELCGFSLATQTNLATAVSELARSVLDQRVDGQLVLLIAEHGPTDKVLVVQVCTVPPVRIQPGSEGYRYAKRLVRGIRLKEDSGQCTAELEVRLPAGTRINAEITDRWRRQLNSAPDVSPYEEIKRKNRQLQEMANRLSESEQQYRDLTNSLPLIICTVDSTGKLLFANKWLLDYSGHTLDELNADLRKSFIHPEDYPGVMENIAKFSSGNFQRERVYRLKEGRTGDYRWHMGTVTPVRNEEGSVKYWSLFLADIQAQKEMEAMLKDNQELRETKQLLEEKVEALDISNKQLEQFAYVASHDLQEPLRKIMHFSDYLASRYVDSLPGEVHDILQRMSAATDRMKLMIHDVLAYSTIPTENALWQRVDLNKVVQEVLQELELSILEKQAQIIVSELPAIQGINVQLKQVFLNLLNNALKYSDPGRQTVIEISGMVSEGHLELIIADNGIGFEDQYLPKMFAIFQRLHARDKYSGTGIGLAICKKIVELHKGSITATGVLGSGARFIIQLPLVQEGVVVDEPVPTNVYSQEVSEHSKD